LLEKEISYVGRNLHYSISGDVIRATAKRVVRKVLESAGFRVYHRDVLPYGVEYMLDIERLARIWNLPIRTFFDIGANLGQTSRLALTSFSEAQVFAFEPDPVTFAKLLECLGKHPRLMTYNVALSNASGSVPFFRYTSSTLSSLIPNAQYPMRKGVTPERITVECTTLDGFCGLHSVQLIDVLKVDTEGGDFFVLQGARQLLSAGRVRFVYLEFNDMSPRAGSTGGALAPISDFLAQFGFRFVATYPDYMEFGIEMHVGANALFVHPPVNATGVVG
jgi:FkbM family methyltransferase